MDSSRILGSCEKGANPKSSVYGNLENIPLPPWKNLHNIVGKNNQEYRLKYLATHSSIRSFARTTRAHSLNSLTPSIVGQWMIRWLFILYFFLFWPTYEHTWDEFFLKKYFQSFRSNFPTYSYSSFVKADILLLHILLNNCPIHSNDQTHSKSHLENW